ncbi:MAG: hypothetical protein HUJ53_00950, partial [Holdemanella sp.]|nr:hypothetical protein [Holdemanella sp.]
TILKVDPSVQEVTYSYEVKSGINMPFTLTIYDRHYHKGVLTEAKEATCVDNGNPKYYTCSCGKYFKDQNGQEELTKEQLINSALGHIDTNNDGICDRCLNLQISGINFTDAIFRSYLSDYYDWNEDGYLSEEEINEVTYIDVCGDDYINIQALDGLKYFPELVQICCNDTKITSLDLSDAVNVKAVTGSNSLLETVNLTKNGDLEKIDFSDCTNLKSIDLSKNENLTHITLNNTSITSLDLSKNSKVQRIYLSNSNLETLDLSNNPGLQLLSVDRCHLTSLDLNNNPKLFSLSCMNNSYDIEVVNNQFDLKTLPDGFNINKASNWIGATLNGNILTVNADVNAVTYTYDTGYESVTFKLNIASRHNCKGTLVPGTPSTCIKQGIKDYYICDCDKVYEDEACTKEIDDLEQWKIAPYADHKDSNKDGKCDICSKVITYMILEGTNQTVIKGQVSNVKLVCNGDFDKFTGLEVDGKELSTSKYTAVSGSTIVSLKKEYVETLSVGVHTIRFNYKDGYVSTTLTVKQGSVNPHTGANNNLTIWLSVFGVAALALIGMIIVRKKSNKL